MLKLSGSHGERILEIRRGEGIQVSRDSVPVVTEVRLMLDPYWYIMTFGDMKDVA